MPRKGLKQIHEWLTLTDTANDAIAASTLVVYNLVVGTTDLLAGQPIDEGTIRRVFLYYSIVQGAADGVWHAGLMVQNNEGNSVNPRTSANDARWMWWGTGFLAANNIFNQNDFNTRPVDVKVMRKIQRNDVLRFYYVNTTASALLIQARVMLGAGLRRA